MSEGEQLARAIQESLKTYHREQGGSTSHGTSGNQPGFYYEQPHHRFHTRDEDEDLVRAVSESMQDYGRCFFFRRLKHICMTVHSATSPFTDKRVLNILETIRF